MSKVLFFDMPSAFAVIARMAGFQAESPTVLHPFDREDEYVERDGRTLVKCGRCGVEYGVGDSPVCRDGHGRVPNGYGDGFEPRFDWGLGEHVTGWGDIHKAMRENHLDYRDHPSEGDTTARLDRIAEQKRRARG